MTFSSGSKAICFGSKARRSSPRSSSQASRAASYGITLMTSSPLNRHTAHTEVIELQILNPDITGVIHECKGEMWRMARTGTPCMQFLNCSVIVAASILNGPKEPNSLADQKYCSYTSSCFTLHGVFFRCAIPVRLHLTNGSPRERKPMRRTLHGCDAAFHFRKGRRHVPPELL